MRGIAIAAVAAVWVVVRVGAAAGADDESGVLRWKLEPGRELFYTLAQTTVVECTPEGGDPIRSERRQEVDFRLDVEKAEGDSAEVALVVGRVRARVVRDGLPPGGLEFDTASAPVAAAGASSARLGSMLTGLAGARLEFRMTPRGEARDVRIPDQLAAALSGSAAVVEGGGPASLEALRNLVAATVPLLPEGAAEPGATWTRQAVAPMPALGSLVLDKTYVDRGPRPDRPEIHDVDVETRFSLRPMPGAMMEMTLTRQSGTGTFAFDARRGLVESGLLEDALTIGFACSEGCWVRQSASTRIELKFLGEPTP